MQFEERDFLFPSFLPCFYIYPAAGTKNAGVSQFPVTECGICYLFRKHFIAPLFKFYLGRVSILGLAAQNGGYINIFRKTCVLYMRFKVSIKAHC